MCWHDACGRWVCFECRLNSVVHWYIILLFVFTYLDWLVWIAVVCLVVVSRFDVVWV